MLPRFTCSFVVFVTSQNLSDDRMGENRHCALKNAERVISIQACTLLVSFASFTTFAVFVLIHARSCPSSGRCACQAIGTLTSRASLRPRMPLQWACILVAHCRAWRNCRLAAMHRNADCMTMADWARRLPLAP